MPCAPSPLRPHGALHPSLHPTGPSMGPASAPAGPGIWGRAEGAWGLKGPLGGLENRGVNPSLQLVLEKRVEARKLCNPSLPLCWGQARDLQAQRRPACCPGFVRGKGGPVTRRPQPGGSAGPQTQARRPHFLSAGTGLLAQRSVSQRPGVAQRGRKLPVGRATPGPEWETPRSRLGLLPGFGCQLRGPSKPLETNLPSPPPPLKVPQEPLVGGEASCPQLQGVQSDRKCQTLWAEPKLSSAVLGTPTAPTPPPRAALGGPPVPGPHRLRMGKRQVGLARRGRGLGQLLPDVAW